MRLVVGLENATGSWDPITVGAATRHGHHRRATLARFVFDGRHWWRWDSRRNDVVENSQPLENYNGTVHLSSGVDPQAAVLAVILDAVHSDGRHRLDLQDIKTVLSESGSRIARLRELDDTQRRHAEQALYVEILKRCTTL